MYQLHNSVPVAYMGKVRMKMSEIKFSDGMPERDNGDYPANTSDAGFAEGWNQCIDEITGGNFDD